MARWKAQNQDSNSPAAASAKTYYACRNIIAEKFKIAPQGGSSARAAFEATILFLIREIESGNTMNGTSATQMIRRNVAIGIEFFSQEQILEALEDARLSFANDDIYEVSRKDLIARARNLMSEKYGLAKTILRPKAKGGVYAAFNDQMQRFFKRSGDLAKSLGSQPSSM